MTLQELKELHQIINDKLNGKSNIVDLRKELDRLIPKKPITETVNRGISVSGEYDIDFNYLCPNCNTVVGDYETDDIFYKFCPDCGQALDWSENNG